MRFASVTKRGRSSRPITYRLNYLGTAVRAVIISHFHLRLLRQGFVPVVTAQLRSPADPVLRVLVNGTNGAITLAGFRKRGIISPSYGWEGFSC